MRPFIGVLAALATIVLVVAMIGLLSVRARQHSGDERDRRTWPLLEVLEAVHEALPNDIGTPPSIDSAQGRRIMCGALESLVVWFENTDKKEWITSDTIRFNGDLTPWIDQMFAETDFSLPLVMHTESLNSDGLTASGEVAIAAWTVMPTFVDQSALAALDVEWLTLEQLMDRCHQLNPAPGE